MGHAHESNKKRIWIVLAILTIITTVEVAFGIVKPDAMHLHGWGTSWLNWFFIILTLVKAYYIAWAFMHLEGEKTWFRRAIVWVLVFLVSYLLFIVLIEGGYLNETLAPLVKW